MATPEDQRVDTVHRRARTKRSVCVAGALAGLVTLIVAVPPSAAAGPSIKLVPDYAVRGAPFRVKVLLVSRQPIGAYTLQLLFASSAAEVLAIAGEGEFSTPVTNSQAFRSGRVRFSAFQASRMDGPTGRVPIATLTLRPRGPVKAIRLEIEPIIVADTDGRKYRVRKHTRTIRLRKR